MMLELAKDLGWPVAPGDWTYVVNYDEIPLERDPDKHDDADVVMFLMDQAEAWLNSNVAAEGYSFGWHDGEFFYSSTEWWEEES